MVSAITPYNGAIIMAFQKLIPRLWRGTCLSCGQSADPTFVTRLWQRSTSRWLPAGACQPFAIEDRG